MNLAKKKNNGLVFWLSNLASYYCVKCCMLLIVVLGSIGINLIILLATILNQLGQILEYRYNPFLTSHSTL